MNSDEERIRKKLYGVWRGMRYRCYTPTSNNYKYYGARGIQICDEWALWFENFLKWALANGYREGLTIERKNNNGNYSPENCEWITHAQQGVNKRARKKGRMHLPFVRLILSLAPIEPEQEIRVSTPSEYVKFNSLARMLRKTGKIDFKVLCRKVNGTYCFFGVKDLQK